METLLRELRMGVRILFRRPGLTSIAVLALALGIGLTTTMYSIVNGVVLQGLPFEESERLLHIERNNLAQGVESLEVPIHDYLDYRQQQSSFEDLAGFYSGTVYVAGSAGRPVRYEGGFVTASTFELLRVRPQLGRLIREGEDRAGAEVVAVLSHRVWQDRYRGAADVLGRAIRVNGEPATIVGVMPEGFAFPESEQIWVPLRLDPLELPRGQGSTLEVMGRLKQGVTQEQASTEMAGIAARLAESYPDTNEGVSTVVKPFINEFIGDEAIGLLFTMLGAVFGVLLIACANVANLLLARASVRVREVAVRSALGAGRLRLIGQHLVESTALAVLGSILGVGLAYVGIGWFNSAMNAAIDVPFWFDIGLNGRVALFVVGVTALASLAAGVFPALQVTRSDVNAVLKDDSRGASGLRIGRFSKALVITEVALSCGLLVGAALMIKSVVKLETYDLEYQTEGVFTARLGLFEADYPEVENRRGFFGDLRERLESRPGVRAAALATGLPLWGTGRERFELDGVAYGSEKEHPRAGSNIISPGYFDAFGLDIVAGRDVERTDAADSLPVAVVSQSFADQFLDGDALGRRFKPDSDGDEEEPWRTIVGVVPDVTQLGTDEQRPAIWYQPLAQSDARFASIIVRTDGPPMSLTTVVRDEVAALDPNLPIYWVRDMDEVVARQTWFYGVFGTLFMVFGAIALFLASIGLYAVMAFSVSRRSREIGIRMAIGAETGHVLRMVLRQGLVQLGIGLGIGLLIAAGFSQLLGVLLFEVEPWDPTVFASILVVLSATGLVATLVPARRATRVDPAVSLHYE